VQNRRYDEAYVSELQEERGKAAINIVHNFPLHLVLYELNQILTTCAMPKLV
jgi:hypothetical protein